MTTATQEFTSVAEHRAWLQSQAELPRGFRIGTTRLSFTPVEAPKPAQMNICVLALDQPSPDFAAMFTRNAFPGAPVRIGRRRLDEPALGAIIINNKISNVCAPDGEAASERLCTELAQLLAIPTGAVLPSSTGVIGWRLPVESMLAALPQALDSFQNTSVLPAADAIMTTDLYAKVRRIRVGAGSIVGIAKGAGMIEPNLATMLVYLLTDIKIPRLRLRQLLAEAVAPSFNAISIDSDQSTSDTVVAVSSGKVSIDNDAEFAAGLRQVCLLLAQDVVRNGEGVHHVMRVNVSGAPSMAIARGISKSVLNSPLVQCAVCGNDPNVGRLVMAVGKYMGNEHPQLDLSATCIHFGGQLVYADSAFQLTPLLEKRLSSYMHGTELYASAAADADGVFHPPVTWPVHERTVDIDIDLGLGSAQFCGYGADRSHEYISENADYRS